MEPSELKEFFGVPVLVQMKGPIVGLGVTHKQALDYAEDKTPSWIPEALMEDGGPAATQIVQFAVLQDSTVTNMVVMYWQAIPPADLYSRRKPATMATLLNVDQIAFISRVVSVREPSTIIL